MKSPVYAIFLIAIVLSGFAEAGDRKGNGGDVVVCRATNQDIISARLLDYFEASEIRDIHIDDTLAAGTQNYHEIISRILDRLSKLAPARASRYTERATKFESEASFKNITLEDIPDSDHLGFPEGCKVEQIVIRQVRQFPEDRLFIVNKTLWDHLDSLNKAGLVLHEMVYEEAIVDYHHSNSIGARYINAMIASLAFKTLSEKDFIAGLRAAHFSWSDYAGVRFRTEPDLNIPATEINFYDDGSLARLSPAWLINTSFPNIRHCDSCEEVFDPIDISFEKKDGTLISTQISFKGTYYQIKINNQWVDMAVKTVGDDIYFHTDGSVELTASTGRTRIGQNGELLPLTSFRYSFTDHNPWHESPKTGLASSDFFRMTSLGGRRDNETSSDPGRSILTLRALEPVTFSVFQDGVDGVIKVLVPAGRSIGVAVGELNKIEKNFEFASLSNPDDPFATFEMVEPTQIHLFGMTQIIQPGTKYVPYESRFKAATSSGISLNVPTGSVFPRVIQASEIFGSTFLADGLQLKIENQQLNVACPVRLSDHRFETCFRQRARFRRADGHTVTVKPLDKVALNFHGEL